MGPLLADALAWGFVDLDTTIERRAGMEVGAIFEKSGEAVFRHMESEALRDVLASAEPHVIATGGGTLCSEANRQLAMQRGTVVWLRVAPDRAAARCAADPATATLRPLLERSDPVGALEGLLTARSEAYGQAAIAVDTDGLTAAGVATRVREELSDRFGEPQ